MQMDLHKTLYCFYTTKKIPNESTCSIRIYFEIILKRSSRLYESDKKVCFLPSVKIFAELAHKSRYYCELHTNESQMDLNYQQLPFAALSFACAGWTELTSEIFCPNCWTLRLSEMLLLFINCLISNFASTFYKQVIIENNQHSDQH